MVLSGAGAGAGAGCHCQGTRYIQQYKRKKGTKSTLNENAGEKYSLVIRSKETTAKPALTAGNF